MEFGVFKTGAKQYKVAVGDVVKIEKIKGDYKKGDKVVFDEVLAVFDDKNIELGTPFVAKKKIEATIEMVGRNKKIDVIKYKSKSNYFKKTGHRQPFFKVKITSIA